jgi:hypothetical protein
MCLKSATNCWLTTPSIATMLPCKPRPRSVLRSLAAQVSSPRRQSPLPPQTLHLPAPLPPLLLLLLLPLLA